MVKKHAQGFFVACLDGEPAVRDPRALWDAAK
jgi:hypothetical protein